MRKLAPPLGRIQDVFQDSSQNFIAIFNEHKAVGEKFPVREMSEDDFDTVMRGFAYKAGIEPVIHDDNVCVFDRVDYDRKAGHLPADLSKAFSFVKFKSDTMKDYLFDEKEARRLGENDGMIKLNYD